LIAQTEVSSLMDQACPSFARSPESALVPADAGPYPRLLQVALYALRRLVEGDDEPLVGVLGVAETVFRRGDVDARELIEFGLIGELTNVNLWPPGVDPRHLLAHLGPLARRTRAVQVLAAQVDPQGAAGASEGGGVWWADIWLHRPGPP